MRWFKIGGNLLLLFLGALFKSELARIDEADPIQMIGTIPIAWSSVLYGLIVSCGAAFAVLNWAGIRYVLGAYRRLQNRRANEERKVRDEGRREGDDVANIMMELKKSLDYNPNLPFDSVHRPPNVSSFITIHARELLRLGLAPPENANPSQWIFHLDRLIPFVRAYGIRGAKKEMEGWYSGEDSKQL